MKRTHTLLFLCLALLGCIHTPLSAQNGYPYRSSDGAYLKAEQAPVFPGHMDQWLSTQAKGDKKVLRYGLSGCVPVEFVVSSKGKTKHIKVSSQTDPRLAKAVKKAVRKMPRWRPGYIGSKAVDVLCNTIVCVSSSANMPTHRLIGTWQQCHSIQKRNGRWKFNYLYSRFKELHADGTFRNIHLYRQEAKAKETGTFYIKDGSHYVEDIAQSTDRRLRGYKNTLTYEFLNADLIKITYRLPGMSYTACEYWKRINQDR